MGKVKWYSPTGAALPFGIFPAPISRRQDVAGPGDGGHPAEGTAGGRVQALPFGKDKAAVPAASRQDVETMVRSRRFGDVIQMGQHFFFRQRQQLGELPDRAVLFEQQPPQGLAMGLGLIRCQGTPCVI